MTEKKLKQKIKLKETVSKKPSRSRAPKELLLPDQLLPPNLFVLPIETSIVFPTMMAPINVIRPSALKTVQEVLKRERVVGLILKKSKPRGRKSRSADLYTVGVAAKILKEIKMPDGSVNILVHALKRFKIKKVLGESPFLVVLPDYLEDEIEKSNEMDALSRTVISDVKKLSEVNPFFTEEMKMALLNAPGPGAVADLVAFALSLPADQSQDFLETVNVRDRYEKLVVHLRREHDLARIQKKIQDDVNQKISDMQREHYLREQLRSIRKELGMEEDGKSQASREFREFLQEKTVPAEVKKVVESEIDKLENISDHSPEFNVVRSYLETLTQLPWGEYTKDNLDLERAEKILHRDHYGLEKVKERILEFLAVRKLTEQKKKDPSKLKKGSIICLVGPPGVGKTSVGRSIAQTMGRKFYRFSLGGMRDEAEIKGHRRTYIGAMPGKIVQAVKRAGTQNPVLMLDEVDKLGQSFQGDPASALLEVLDPEQNSAFLDHYLDVPFDLSQVLFVATANNMASIPAPLLDRMEIIELPGYTLEEKEKIASRYVIPKVLQQHALTSKQVKIEKPALKAMMLDYAREPGLRTLQQLIERLSRKAATELVKNKRKKTFVVKKTDLTKLLGPKRFYNELTERIRAPGVVVGLAWTAMGGDILFIEASETPGAGQLKLTGQMGDVMTESANISWSYVKKKLARDRQYDSEFFKKKDLHVHIPAGAIPKDGPSAGVTMATALYSLMTGKKSKQKFAMTGELSLTGKVLPVGGIKEKLLAAKRAGISTVVLPKLNKKDLAEVPPYALKGLKLHWVDHVEEVFRLILQSK